MTTPKAATPAPARTDQLLEAILKESAKQTALLSATTDQLAHLTERLSEAEKLLDNPAVKLAARAKTAWRGLS